MPGTKTGYAKRQVQQWFPEMNERDATDCAVRFRDALEDLRMIDNNTVRDHIAFVFYGRPLPNCPCCGRPR